MESPSTSPRVYPRLRGGSPSLLPEYRYAPGLSPPTRGIHYLIALDDEYAGSIPAYAGDPHALRLFTEVAKVYPRLRGGSSTIQRMARYMPGLSPPTRGILPTSSLCIYGYGSIPAYAGDPWMRVRQGIARRVYPRLRGGSNCPD